jgi:hypothetical protein
MPGLLHRLASTSAALSSFGVWMEFGDEQVMTACPPLRCVAASNDSLPLTRKKKIGVVSPVSGAGLGEMPKSDEGVRFADV